MTLIDADKYFDLIVNAKSTMQCIEKLHSMLAVDAVPVVRCKNCEYGEIEDPEFPDQYFCHAHGCDWNEGDHFCSNGKEKVKGGS